MCALCMVEKNRNTVCDRNQLCADKACGISHNVCLRYFLSYCLSFFPLAYGLSCCLPVCAPAQASSGVPTVRDASSEVGGATARPTAPTTQMRWAAKCHPEVASIAAATTPAASPTPFCATARRTALTAQMSSNAVRDVGGGGPWT